MKNLNKIVLTVIFFVFSQIIFAQYSNLIVTIDPGHGGTDPGALGYNGSAYPDEKDLTLEIATLLRTELINRGFSSTKVRRTRTSDVYVGIIDRKNYINAQNPDASVSIHFNSFTSASANGTETLYYHNNILANKFQSFIVNAMNTTNRGVIYRDNLGVLQTYSSIPAALTESLFISNQSNWNLINSTSGKNNLKNAHADALINFFGVVVSPPTLITPSANATNVSIPVNFSWSSVPNASAYRLSISTSSSGFNPTATPMFPGATEFAEGVFTSKSWTGAQPGTTYYWAVRVHTGSGNATSSVRSFTTANSSNSNDIFVQNQAVTPTSVAPGGTIDASCDQYYSGNTPDANLENPYLGYYLSTNTSFSSSSDTYLGEDSSGIGSDDLYDTESVTLTIPTGTSPGTYYILFVADYTNLISETNENNNVAFSQITVSGSSSSNDIFVQNQAVTPTSVAPGGTIDASCDQYYSGNTLVMICMIRKA